MTAAAPKNVRAIPASRADGREHAGTARPFRSRGRIGTAGAALLALLAGAANPATAAAMNAAPLRERTAAQGVPPGLPSGSAGTGFAREIAVTVLGEVNRPGTYAVAPGETLSALILRVGGFTDNAYLRGAALTRKREAARQGKELEGIARSLEERIARGKKGGEGDGPRGAGPAAPRPGEGGVRPGGDPRAPDDAAAFLARLRALPPSGRLPVRLSHPRLLKGSERDIALEDGDTLVVPPPDRSVAVAGAVRSPGRFPLDGEEGAGRPPGRAERRRVDHYVRAAGGYADDADPGGAFLLSADGTAVRLSSGIVAWDPGRARWEFTAFRKDRPSVGPGDTVAVPRSARRIAWLKEAGDISPLLARIAEIAGAVVLP